MNNKILDELFRVNKNLIIPNYMIKYYSKLELEGLNFLFMIYLLNNKDNISFDINRISNELNQDSSVILELINDLNEKNLISIEMKKTNGVIEEYISLDLFYNKINSFVMEEKSSTSNKDIYSLFEKEFGRTLSPTEYETITNWIKSNIDEEIIRSALKEAVLSGVNNLRYIDKILFEWNKKGYKTVSDIKNKNQKEDYIEEIYDYDWINE